MASPEHQDRLRATRNENHTANWPRRTGTLKDPGAAYGTSAAAHGADDEQLATLTERERAVLQLVTRGLTNKQIAAQLRISPFTVNMHLRAIYGKLAVTSRAAATRRAIELGLA